MATSRSLRETTGLTTRQAAERAGFGQPKLVKLETGRLTLATTDALTLAGMYQLGAGRTEVTAVCGCGRDLRVHRGVLEARPIRCGLCEALSARP